MSEARMGTRRSRHHHSGQLSESTGHVLSGSPGQGLDSSLPHVSLSLGGLLDGGWSPSLSWGFPPFHVYQIWKTFVEHWVGFDWIGYIILYFIILHIIYNFLKLFHIWDIQVLHCRVQGRGSYCSGLRLALELGNIISTPGSSKAKIHFC